MEADMITLALTVGVVLLIAKCFWTSDDASPGGPGQRRQRGDGAASSAASGPRKPLSLAAQSVQKELGATYGRAITISTVGILLTRSGPGQPLALIKEAVAVVKALVEFADVFLITEVADEAESAAVTQVLKQTGCISEQGGGAGSGIAQHVSSRLIGRRWWGTYAATQPVEALQGWWLSEGGAVSDFDCVSGLAAVGVLQKLLFCSTAIGRQAIVRQLKPQLHVDQDDGLLSKLVPYISRLLRIDATFEGKPDSLPYRVLPSLQALLPKDEGTEKGAAMSSG